MKNIYKLVTIDPNDKKIHHSTHNTAKEALQAMKNLKFIYKHRTKEPLFYETKSEIRFIVEQTRID